MTRLFEEFAPVSTAEWEAQIARDLKGKDPKTLVWKADDGIEVKPFYRSEDLAAITAKELFPARRWKIGCEVSDPESAQYAISRGATVLYVENENLTGAGDNIEIIRGDKLIRAAGGTPAQELASMLKQAGAGSTVEFAVGPTYFFEIAKFRAARLLWPRVSKQQLRILARTAKRNQSIYDPYVNLLRGTTEAMSAIIGGCDILIVRPFDEAYKDPGEFSRRLSINTQLLLRDESYFDAVADPAAGCWYLEWLTDQLAQKAGALYEGTAEPVKTSKRPAIVGVNRYTDAADRALERIEIAPAQNRDAWPFENLRLQSERYAKATGRAPSVLLVEFGDPKMRRARADFSANFFAAGGFSISRSSAADAVAAVNEKRPDIVVLCSSDAEYAAMARTVCSAVKTPVMVAGNPAGAAELKAAGVADFIGVHSDVVQTIADWQKKLGIVQ